MSKPKLLQVITVRGACCKLVSLCAVGIPLRIVTVLWFRSRNPAWCHGQGVLANLEPTGTKWSEQALRMFRQLTTLPAPLMAIVLRQTEVRTAAANSLCGGSSPVVVWGCSDSALGFHAADAGSNPER